MPTKTTIPFDQGVFSITFTCVQWLPLIEVVQAYDLIYKWFAWLKANNHFIVGYVIMPNHLHVMIGFTKTEQTINTLIGSSKRFLAHDILKLLHAAGEAEVLSRLRRAVGKEYRERKKIHQVWEYSFDWKHCISEQFILQKLNYYHKNPCSGKWSLVENPADYKHSSAMFYHSGTTGLFEITHFKNLPDMFGFPQRHC